MSRNNHLNNEIYIHDLNSYAVGMHNCLSIPFDKLLANGFNTRQTDVRPAQSVSTAFQLVAVIFQLQSLQQFGGVSATHLDWTMIPYVRKSFYKHYKNGLKYINESLNPLYKEFTERMNDTTPINEYTDAAPKAYQYAMDMTEKEVYQAVEGLYHNLNTLQSRSGNQLPFTSINYGTCTEPEGRMVTKALLDVSIKGIGKLHKTSIFPCGIFQCMKGVNRESGDPNYDLFRLALRSTAQRLYPNYAKFKGIYRIKVPYNQWTKDFTRKLNGNLEDVDCYIDCMYGNKVFHYGRDVLQAYIPSLGRGHNILKSINEIDQSIIFDIEETDSEILFKFKYADSDKIIPLLKPKTSGANISPFSSRNLPKNKTFKIPDEQLEAYQEIVSKIPQERILTLTHRTNSFIKSLATKRNPIENIKADMKLKGLRGKEYIYSIGEWDNYIKFLIENI